MADNIRINAIAAICNHNNGIGKENDLPWSISEDYHYFLRVIETTVDKSKINCVIMGRLTWLSLPKESRPLGRSLHIIVSNNMKTSDIECKSESLKENVLICHSLEEAIDLVKLSYSNKIETIYACGGVSIYNAIVEREDFDRFYLTRMLDFYECDVFIKSDFLRNFKKIPTELLEDDSKLFQCDYNVVKSDVTNGAKYVFEVYEKQKN